MTTNLRKIHAIFNLKTRLILTNTSVMVAPLLAIGMVIMMRFLIRNTKMSPAFSIGFLLGIGLLFNIVMGGFMMASAPLAEEKEKQTLRVLMTSGVTGLDYFVGSLLPPFVILMVTNLLLIPLSGTPWQQLPFGNYLLITAITTLISLLLGSLVGLLSRNQAEAGLLCLPPMLLLTLAPSFRMFNAPLRHAVRYLYAGTLTRLADGIGQANFHWQLLDILVLLSWLGLSLGAFLVAYRRNGLDTD